MTIQAVAILQTIARAEFERDWNGFEDDPYGFIEGTEWTDPPAPPVKEIVVEVAGKSYVFPAEAVVATIQHWEEIFRDEAHEEVEELDEDERYSYTFDEGEVISEKIESKLQAHFFAQLDSAEEALAALENRLDYMVKGFKELVAYTEMIGERQPALRPVLAERLQTVYDYVTAYFQEWVDQQGGEHEDEV